MKLLGEDNGFGFAGVETVGQFLDALLVRNRANLQESRQRWVTGAQFTFDFRWQDNLGEQRLQQMSLAYLNQGTNR